MARDPKPLRYLITVERWQQNDQHGIMRGAPERLRHLQFETITTRFPHYAQDRAERLARDFALKLTKDLTKQVWDGPAKGWRVVPPEGLSPVTIKVERAKYRPRKVIPAPRSDISAHDAGEAQAIAYARWLARRDGIELPTAYGTTKTSCTWESVEIPGKTRGQRFYDGMRQVAATEKRISAVAWGHEEDVYNTRKDGRRGAWLYKAFVADVLIAIPNWDFVPSFTEEIVPAASVPQPEARAVAW